MKMRIQSVVSIQASHIAISSLAVEKDFKHTPDAAIYRDGEVWIGVYNGIKAECVMKVKEEPKV